MRQTTHKGFGAGCLRARPVILLSLVLVVSGSVRAVDEIDIGHAPVFVLQGVAPNLVLTLDDSSSMALANANAWFNEPSYDGSDTSSLTNPINYDPGIVYLPPLDAAGDSVGHADFGAAPRDFYTNRMACDASCKDGLLSGQASVASCAALCGTRTSCTLDLGTHYAPLWYEEYEPCSELSVVAVTLPDGTTVEVPTMRKTTRSDGPEDANLYTIDVGHAAFDGPSNGIIGTDEGVAWALRCIYDLRPDGSPVPVVGDAAIDDCPAYYHVFDPSGTYTRSGGEAGSARPCSELTARLPGLQADEIPAQCLTRVLVGSSEELTLTEQAIRDERRRLLEGPDEGLSDARLAERNFANWYAYYRTRWRTLQASISRVIAGLDPTVRVAYQGMAQADTGPGTAFFDNELLPSFGDFDTAARERFLTWLYGRRPTVGTFLLSSALRVENFCSSDPAYLQQPGLVESEDNPLFGCRNNFHLLFTDGDWTDDFSRNALTAPAWLGNNDGTATDLPADRAFATDLGIASYNPATLVTDSTTGATSAEPNPSTRIFADSNTGGLADIVFHSWISDLRPDLNGDANRVRTLIWEPVVDPDGDPKYVFWNPANDPADWQHVTTYTVGFGVTGNVAYPDGSYLEQGQLKNIATDGFPGLWTTLGGGSGVEPRSGDKVDDLWHAGVNGRGGFSTAKNPTTLIETFRDVMDDVSSVAGRSAVAAPALNTSSAATGRMLVQATLDTEDWTGDLRAFRISGGIGQAPCTDADVPYGDLCEDPRSGYYWSAAEELDADAEAGNPRRIVTAAVSIGADGQRTETEVVFAGASWSELGPEQQRALLTGLIDDGEAIPDETSAPVLEAKARIDYVAGERDYESSVRFGSAAYAFRDRNVLLGDIINSGPVIVGPPSRFFSSLGYSTGLDGGESFKQQYADRPELVYVGANDGMLHAFDAATGTERFAYVPPVLFDKLWKLTDPAYGEVVQHDNFVDGPIAEGDAYFGGGWHSVLVSALGRGAQGLFALDVTNPTADTADPLHLWQFTDADDADLGYVFGKPAIVRVRNPSGGDPLWVAIFGNGYSSSENDGHRPVGCDDETQDTGSTACARAVLYVVNLADGRIIAKMDTGVGRKDDPNHDTAAEQLPNGLGQPTVVARTLDAADGDLLADFAYAGDLFGNLWRFDLTDLASPPVKVFSASYEPSDESEPGQPAVAQPITAPIAVAAHPTGVGTLVLFGTGRYLGLSDVSDNSIQSFYGIWDRGDVVAEGSSTSSLPVPRVARSALLRQELLHTDIRVTSDGTEVSRGRTSSRYTIDWGTHDGWYIDLSIDRDANGDNKGERVTSAPQVRGNRVVFVSLVPEGNPCLSGGYSWVNALSYTSGSALQESPFDFNLDGTWGAEDLLVVGDEPPTAGSSLRLTVAGGTTGIYSAPAVMPLSGGDVRTLVSTSQGDLIDLRESPVLEWRVWGQLR